ncbi:Cell division cycle protein cdt2 [Paramyrothecium foliicola]|nr:Cell division cycle protein cdt2 [Paramyrothecium foliicola]
MGGRPKNMERHGLLSDSILPPSSPITMSSPSELPQSPTRSSRRKPRGNPSITPRRFGRFFTPRSALAGGGRKILGNLSAAAVNSYPLSPQSLVDDALSSDPICPSPSDRPGVISAEGRKRRANDQSEPVVKRRGVLLEDIALPKPDFRREDVENAGSRDVVMQDIIKDFKPGQDVLGQRRKAVLNHFFKAPRTSSKKLLNEATNISALTSPHKEVATTEEPYRPRPIRKFGNRGFEAQLLDREHGYAQRAGRQHLTFPAYDVRAETAPFYSRNLDLVHCTSQSGQGNTIPFCLSSSRSAPITAIGDEEGCVRFLNTSMTESPSESKISFYGKIHDNAIMDLSFSEDDMRLATACGDRTGKIIDVATETVAVNLDVKHQDSLRQVAFQPGQASGNVLATSDRAGRIQIWDLRCSSVPVGSFSTRSVSGTIRRNPELRAGFAQTVNTIDNAHQRTTQGITSSASVTAIQWLPAGREHLLLTASEANASIKLWDTRYMKPRRQAEETPVAATPEPSTHAWRSYGITSLALGSDAARLYAVCRDSTVYAYSVAHLVLGHAPELVDNASKRRPTGAEGMGPLYGFRHDMFRAHSFYVKSAIRPAGRDGRTSDMLAVGSSSSCAMLFPLDERHMRTAWDRRAHLLDDPARSGSFTTTTPSQSFSSTPSFSGPSSSPIPIFRAGTPLIRGHAREVAVPSWSYDGKLVTASDDYIVRHWQQGDGSQARHLRRVGEFGGERHMAGWADVEDDWDMEDDEA